MSNEAVKRELVGWVEEQNPTNRILPNKVLQLTAAAFGFSSVKRQMMVFGLSDVSRKLPPQLNLGC